MRAEIQILIVEDHPIFRMGLKELINLESDMAVCGEAEDVSSARKLIRQQEPDLIVLDLALKESNGIDLIRQLRAERRKIPILVLSMHDEALHAQRCMLAGASGYIMKQEVSLSVIKAIRTILSGNIYVSENIMTLLLTHLRFSSNAPQQSPTDHLTDRELEVFRMIGGGLTPKKIAGHLKVSVKTIGTYKERIKDKMGFKHGGELVRFAVLWKENMP
jgi:DNA-binding NarL/FixJ family response regulator